MTSIKTKHIEANKKRLVDLAQKVKLISTAGLTEDFINKYSVPNGAKNFSSDRLQNYLSFLPAEVQLASITGNKVHSSESTGMSHESIINWPTSDNSFVLM